MLPGGECWSVMKNLLCMAVLLLQLAFIQGTGAEVVDVVENSGTKNAAFHIGLYDEIGFFSNYTGINFGADCQIGNYRIGLEQKAAFGYTNQEIVGITELRLYPHEQIFVNIGVSYLLAASHKGIEEDFKAAVLPVLGFGCLLPIKHTGIRLVPTLQMNQSYYLTDEIREVYTELPFIIAMTLGLGVELY
jgi:hypothetical protein